MTASSSKDCTAPQTSTPKAAMALGTQAGQGFAAAVLQRRHRLKKTAVRTITTASNCRRMMQGTCKRHMHSKTVPACLIGYLNLARKYDGRTCELLAMFQNFTQDTNELHKAVLETALAVEADRHSEKLLFFLFACNMWDSRCSFESQFKLLRSRGRVIGSTESSAFGRCSGPGTRQEEGYSLHDLGQDDAAIPTDKHHLQRMLVYHLSSE